MKFGIFYELQLPRPWSDDDEYDAAEPGARPDRARRPSRLRLRLGGRAPLPRGVQPLVGAGGVPRRGEPAHEADPARPRHRPAADEPPGARRRADQHARPDQPRPGRVRGRRGEQRHRAAPVRPSLPRQAGGVGGRDALPAADVLGGRLGVPRRVLRLPAAQRRPQAAAAAASAAVGRVQPARHDRDGRPAGDRRPRLPVRVGGGGRTRGCTPTTTRSPSASSRSARTRPTRTSPSSASSCAPNGRGGEGAADGSTFFQFALRFYNEHGPVVPGTVSLWDEYQTWKAGPPGRRRSTAV